MIFKVFYMKKSLIVFVSFFLPFLFFSCASIQELSEPKNDTDCLLYGKVLSCGSVYCYDPNEIDIDKTRLSNEIRFRNIKTNKFLVLKLNQFLEFYKTRIPNGTYIFHSFRQRWYKKDGSYFDSIVKFDKNKTTNFHFIPVEGSVINLGEIYINLTSYEDPSEATQWHVDWDREFQKVHAEFFRRHPDSKWLGKKWMTRHESLEHHLTLFP